jgi:putative Ca2+/H+ antiporter (TMEM165/GDT1 family)
MVAMIVMSSRARPLSVAIGSTLAYVVQMALAVAAGRLLFLVPQTPKDIIVSLLFLGGAAYLLLSKEEEVEAEGEREAQREQHGRFSKEVLTAFSVIFIGEFGDLTQIQAANFSAKFHSPVGVYLACMVGMTTVAFFGSYVGFHLQKVVSLATIRKIGGVIFACLGLYTLLHLIFS